MPRRTSRKNKKDKIAKLLELIEPADKTQERAACVCPDFGVCGGCSFLDLPYAQELLLKQRMVAELLKDQVVSHTNHLKANPENAVSCVGSDGLIPIIPSPNVEGYRNKMEFSFGDMNSDGGGLALGTRNKGRYYEVTVPSKCALIPEDFKSIVLSTLEYFRNTSEEFYHRRRHTGALRYLVLRRGEFTGEILVNLVTTDSLDSSHPEKWTQKLLELNLDLNLEGKITGILHTTSNAVSDAVVPEDVKILWGRDHFYEKLFVNRELVFGISPFSFFQTNSAAAELLYRTVAEFVGRAGAGRIYDLYCGTGTISLALSSSASEVVGIELVAEAVAAAKDNARANGIDNCRFIAGDVLAMLEGGLGLGPDDAGSDDAGSGVRSGVFGPDVLVLDPPRDGVHPKAIGKLIGLDSPWVVYISCKPSSLARDLPFFTTAGYKVVDMRLHDMFPRTPHVETVVLLCRGDI